MPRKIGGRDATVYDAVAGRVAYEGFINPAHAGQFETGSESHTKIGRKGFPVTPEEVLFRGDNAPDRDEENDFYESDRWIPSGVELPDSDLLKATHAYVSDFYAHTTSDGGEDDIGSMDETALLACGILLEEASKDVMGAKGDMVLTEPDPHRLFARHGGPGSLSSHSSTSESGGEPKTKRPRTEKEGSGTSSSTTSGDSE